MTESAIFASAGRNDCYKELGVKKFRVVVGLDEVTCETCGHMEDVDPVPNEERRIGVNCPPFHPNCRCTDVPALDDSKEFGGVRAARDADGNYIEVPADMTFSQWKDKFLVSPVAEKIVGTTTSTGSTVMGIKPHIIDRMKQRGVSSEGIIDALQNPIDITDIKIDEYGNPSYHCIGKTATVVYNPETEFVISCWETGEKVLNKYVDKK